MNKPDVIEKFLKYVKVDTQSDPDSGTSPSTMKQHDLAKLLRDELIEIGASDVYYNALEFCECFEHSLFDRNVLYHCIKFLSVRLW